MSKREDNHEILSEEKFKQLLKEKGLKVTKQRIVLLATLAQRPDGHLTAPEIYDLVRTSHPEIGLATVYRTIQVLLELGLIDRVNFDDGIERYELARTSVDGKQRHHHHHLICVNCGKVYEFEEDMLEGLELKIARETGFKVIDHEVKLYGYCTECGGIIN